MPLSTVRSFLTRSVTNATLEKGAQTAIKLFHEAAERVPAYKDFLKKNGIDHRSIRTARDFAKIPVTDKPSYMNAYSLPELSWDGDFTTASCVSTSSGSTGVPFYWPRARRHDAAINTMIQHKFEDIFDTKSGTTLAVDSFALGQWIAGLEFYNAIKWTAERGSKITVITPGIDKVEAVREIEKLAPYYDRVVIGGYPPFIKDIIDQGSISGINWSTIDLRILAGGEAVSDIWKDRLLERIGRPGEIRRFVTEYGMAEAGVVANETPVSAVLRRALSKISNPALPSADEVVGLYQFYADIRYFENGVNDSLAVTSDAGLPLIRYDTRDTGGVIEYATALELGGTVLEDVAAQYKVDLSSWKLPFVYLKGRKDFSISLYSLNIYVENLKRALESSTVADHLSGMFTMSVDQTETLDQEFAITIELADSVEPNTALAESLTQQIVDTLCRVNTEYGKLYASIGNRARPKVTLVKLGAIETIPGRKHKWFKRVAA